MNSRAESSLDWIAESFRKTPITALLGAKIRSYDPDTGLLVTEYEGKPDFCNLIRTIQGGMLTTMLDNAMSFAALARLGETFRVPSLEIKTNFISPARPGTLVGEGEVVRVGQSIVFLAGRLFSNDGTLIATGSATSMVRKLDKL